MRKFLLLIIGTILFTIIFLNPIIAQTGKIAGRVTDASTGEALPFVNIVIVGTSYGAASDIDGYYFLINLPPGIYSVKASAIGYTSIEVQNVEVASGFTSNQDFNLQSTTLELGEEIVVIAEKPLIQKDLTASTSIIGEDVISQLPVANINDILQLQAGIVTSGADFHVRGGRKGQVVYQIDGVAVTDAYDGSTVIDVNSNAVQELQVISGAFNAEYGQAMSGVINIVTKDGGNDLSGNFQTYIGDYISSRNDKFWNIDDFDPVAIRNFEGSLSGPIIPDKLFFFINGRYTYDAGYIFGKRTFLITDIATEIEGSGGADFNITKSGDDSFVSMNEREKFYAQGKLTYRLLPNMKVNFNYAIDKEEYKDFNHDRKLTPDNNLNRFRIGYSNMLSINHAVSNASFYTINLSYFFKQYQHYLFEEEELSLPFSFSEGKYVNNYIRQTPPYSFEIGGTDYSRFKRSTGTYEVGFNWTSQINQEINIQFGGNFKRHQIFYKDVTLEPISFEGVTYVYVPPIETTQNNQYTHNPLEGAFYVQSKL
ncbi:MAG: carboxypeptidase-like regulatory domain-containing protein, partial [Ignavibacteria bacterium]